MGRPSVRANFGSFALKRIRRTQVRKGMVLVGKTDIPPKGELSVADRGYEAES